MAVLPLLVSTLFLILGLNIFLEVLRPILHFSVQCFQSVFFLSVFLFTEGSIVNAAS